MAATKMARHAILHRRVYQHEEPLSLMVALMEQQQEQQQRAVLTNVGLWDASSHSLWRVDPP